jgi:hypothetical protein
MRVKTMSDPVATLALCKWLRDRIQDWETEAKASLEMVAGERKAAVVNGMQIGYLTLANGKRSTEVDEVGFVEWVEERWPMEVVSAVQPAFRRKLLDGALKRGALIDGDGEVCDAVTVTKGEPYPTTQLGPEADICVAELLNKGRIGFHGFKELEAK